jgi:hypothetical protein
VKQQLYFKLQQPLHVEETALRLTAQVAEQLQVQQVTFLTHNLTLVRAAAARKISDVQVPW